MAKPSMIIDLIGKGPGDEEERRPFDEEEEDEDPEDRAAAQDPDAIIANIQAQLEQLRSAY